MDFFFLDDEVPLLATTLIYNLFLSLMAAAVATLGSVKYTHM